MTPGELRQRIIIEKLGDPPTIQNDNGFDVPNWIYHKTLWAKAENLYGREYYAAAAVQAEKTIKFTIRYCSDIDETMRIKFKNKEFKIIFIDNIKYNNNYMEIKALEVSNG